MAPSKRYAAVRGRRHKKITERDWRLLRAIFEAEEEGFEPSIPR
jgi:hypothetical protein